MITQVLESSAVWGVLLTLAAFGLGVLINKRTGKAIFNPLLLGTAFVIVVLSVLNIPYDTYAASASPVSYLLLPATVSLAVPLYEKWDLLCKNLVAIVAGVLAGVMASLFSVLALALLLDLNHEQYITLLPKSVTTAISMDVSRELGGIATLTGAIVILTGIVGALAAETVCKVFRITNPIAKGIGIGTASHAVGTSKALEIGEVEGAMSGLSVAVAGIMTAVLCPLFSKYRRPAHASPGLWCADGLFVCRRTAENGIFCKFFARQRGQLLPRGGFYTIIKISCLYQLPVQNTEKKAQLRPAIEGWNVRR